MSDASENGRTDGQGRVEIILAGDIIEDIPDEREMSKLVAAQKGTWTHLVREAADQHLQYEFSPDTPVPITRKALLAELVMQAVTEGKVRFPGGTTMLMEPKQWAQMVKWIFDRTDGPVRNTAAFDPRLHEQEQVQMRDVTPPLSSAERRERVSELLKLARERRKRVAESKSGSE